MVVKALVRALSGLAAGAALVIAAVAPALAAGSHGASSTRSENVCERVDARIEVCLTGHETTNQVQTPSGNFIYTDIFRGTQTYYLDGEFLGTDRVAGHHHEVYKSRTGSLQVYHEAFSDAFTVEGITCTSSQRYHEAHGRIQFESETFACQ